MGSDEFGNTFRPLFETSLPGHGADAGKGRGLRPCRDFGPDCAEPVSFVIGETP